MNTILTTLLCCMFVSINEMSGAWYALIVFLATVSSAFDMVVIRSQVKTVLEEMFEIKHKSRAHQRQVFELVPKNNPRDTQGDDG